VCHFAEPVHRRNIAVNEKPILTLNNLGGITPAMAANVTTRLWSVEDIVTLVENASVQAVVEKRSAILASPQSN
jgi:hypothetical protein